MLRAVKVRPSLDWLLALVPVAIGMRLFGAIFRKSGLNCSPRPMFTGLKVYG